MYVGGIWDTAWVPEPQWGPGKFNFISVFLTGHLLLSVSASHCPWRLVLACVTEGRGTPRAQRRIRKLL